MPLTPSPFGRSRPALAPRRYPLLLGLFSWVLCACATAPAAPNRHANDQAAPLDPEVQGWPGAEAYWVTEPEFGGRIYLLESGQASSSRGPPPLLLLHGLGTAGVRDFYPILKALGKHRRVLAFDLPGFGRSSKDNHPYAPPFYALVARNIIERYAGGQADVVGHSMGGAIAIYLAGAYPQNVHKLVLVDAAGILHREAFVGEQLHSATAPARDLLPGFVTAVEEAAGNLLRKARNFEPSPEFIVGNRWLRQYTLSGEPGRIAAMSLITTDFSATIAGVRAPTLVLWGKDDHIAPLRTAYLLKDRVADARLQLLDGSGHVPMTDAPITTASAITFHLDADAALGAAQSSQTQGNYRCYGRSDVKLTGRFDTIVLDSCERVQLDGVRADRLELHNSTAQITDTWIHQGIEADHSLLMMTGGQVNGSPALRLAQSRLDFAGVKLSSVGKVVEVTRTSRLLCSVCTIDVPLRSHFAHGEQVLHVNANTL